jgi:Zn finger protein HypA/HybF involved in hydrogenase expression
MPKTNAHTQYLRLSLPIGLVLLLAESLCNNLVKSANGGFMPVAVPTYECLRCNHKWIPRKPVVPIRCAKCKSPYWNIPKQKNEGTS